MNDKASVNNRNRQKNINKWKRNMGALCPLAKAFVVRTSCLFFLYASAIYHYSKVNFKFKLICVFLKTFCLFLCTSCHQSHLMFPFPTPHPHSCLTTDCHKFACFSLLCVSRVYYKIFIKSQRSDLSQSSLHDITMRSICNHKVNQRHMEANAQTKYDLCCCNIWLVQRSEECLARPQECAMWL